MAVWPSVPPDQVLAEPRQNEEVTREADMLSDGAQLAAIDPTRCRPYRWPPG